MVSKSFKSLLSILFLMSLFLLTSCQKRAEKNIPKPNQVLFVIHSGTGHFQLQGGSETQGQLILENVNESVAYFTDRNSKEAGARNLSEFLSHWNQEPNAFSDHPPTAALVYHRLDSSGGSNQTFEQINLKINHPQYNASIDEVVFDFQLAGSPIHLPLGELEETTLFIDGKAKLTPDQN